MSEPVVLETNEDGTLQIPAGVLGTGPHVRFRVERQGGAVRLVPVGEREPSEETAPRIRLFREFLQRFPRHAGPPIPAEALRRENLYD